MGITSALLATDLANKADINFFTQQQIYWAGKVEANSAKLEKQTGYETKWESAYDEAMNNEKAKTIGGFKVPEKNTNEQLADKYAHMKVSKYDEELSLELAELDVEYDSMQTMYEALLEQARAQQDGLKSALQNAAQDTGLLQS